MKWYYKHWGYFKQLCSELSKFFLNNKGGTVTVIGQDGKPSQIPASSLNLATTPNLPFETFTSNLGAAGKRSLHEIWRLWTRYKLKLSNFFKWYAIE